MNIDRLIEFSGNHSILVMAFFAVLGVLLFSEISRRLSKVASIGCIEATQLSNHKDAVFLDIREDAEYKSGYIPDSIHIPLKQLSDRVSELGKFKGSPVIAYCRSGNRSKSAGEILIKQGFENVYNLGGGILDWQKANLPVSTK